MMLNYNKLFTILKNRNISLVRFASDLKLSSATRAKFAKNETVSMETLINIAHYLGVGLDDLIEIEIVFSFSELHRQLDLERKQKIKGGIYHETQIIMTYNSNHIEGSRLSEDQTRYIFETNTISSIDQKSINIDDVIETKNHFRCIDYVIEHAYQRLSHEFIKELHKILKTGTSDQQISWFNVGEYKIKPNIVGGIEATSPEFVSEEMSSLIGKYESLKEIKFEDVVTFHHDFELIHPFQDGNGRVGRLIAFKECLRHNLVPIVIDEEIKIFYYRGLKEWNNEKGYLLDTCRTGQVKYIKLLEYFRIRYNN